MKKCVLRVLAVALYLAAGYWLSRLGVGWWATCAGLGVAVAVLAVLLNAAEGP